MVGDTETPEVPCGRKPGVATDSVTLCPFTTDPTDAPLFRLLIEPTEANGLIRASRLMVDKITTVRRTKLGERLGLLADADIIRANRAIVVFLGIVASD